MVVIETRKASIAELQAEQLTDHGKLSPLGCG
jgi:hypothetical protein